MTRSRRWSRHSACRPIPRSSTTSLRSSANGAIAPAAAGIQPLPRDRRAGRCQARHGDPLGDGDEGVRRAETCTAHAARRCASSVPAPSGPAPIPKATGAPATVTASSTSPADHRCRDAFRRRDDGGARYRRATPAVDARIAGWSLVAAGGLCEVARDRFAVDGRRRFELSSTPHRPTIRAEAALWPGAGPAMQTGHWGPRLLAALWSRAAPPSSSSTFNRTRPRRAPRWSAWRERFKGHVVPEPGRSREYDQGTKCFARSRKRALFDPSTKWDGSEIATRGGALVDVSGGFVFPAAVEM